MKKNGKPEMGRSRQITIAEYLALKHVTEHLNKRARVGVDYSDGIRFFNPNSTPLYLPESVRAHLCTVLTRYWCG